MKRISSITAEGINVEVAAGAFVTAPLPFTLNDGITDFRYDQEQNGCLWLEADGTENSAELNEEHLAAALAYEPPAPPPVVPDTITRRQFHMVAFQMFGLTAGMIELQIAAIEDEQQRTLAMIDYREASAFRWDWPLLVQFANALGITEEQRKQAWIEGAKIV